MTNVKQLDRARLREPGSVILREFKAAMEAKRAGAATTFQQHQGARRNFAVAQSGPFTAGWQTSDASINALLMSVLPILVQRSRHWWRNTGAGRRFGDLVRTNGVGPVGFTLQMRCGDWRQEKGRWVWKLDKLANDAIEAAWLDWCKRGCEVTGKMTFADVCKLQLEHVARDGEYLARHIKGTKDHKHRYQLQLLNPDRLDIRHNEQPRDGAEVRMGVHRDDKGRATHFTLLKSSPGEIHGTRTADIVPAAEVLHDFVMLEAEQARGVPWSHAVLLGANMLRTFSEFAMFAAQVGASQMGFFTQPASQDVPITPDNLPGTTKDDLTGELSKELAPGALDLLPPGVDFKQFTSQYPSEAFEPFTKTHKRDMAAGLSVAYHNLTGDMEGVNYSSARIAELCERDHWRGVSHWFIGSFVQPVFQAWLEMALLSGEIKLASGQPLPVSKIDKFLAGAVFRGRGWEWVDPLKEVNAYKIAKEEGFTTTSQVVAAKGGDFEDNVVEIAQENQILADNGVTLGPRSAPAAAPMEPDADDEDDGAETTDAAGKAKEGKTNE